jgi:hypothetical protein
LFAYPIIAHCIKKELTNISTGSVLHGQEILNIGVAIKALCPVPKYVEWFVGTAPAKISCPVTRTTGPERILEVFFC